MLRTFRKGGIHPQENKLTQRCRIEDLPVSAEYAVALSQHIGAPAECCVKAGDRVAKYQLIGRKQGNVSANVHSPVSGTVKRIERRKNAFGFDLWTVVIVPEGEDVCPLSFRTFAEAEALPAAEIRSLIEEAGVVGLGGATFPTSVKLQPPKNSKVDTLVINAAECEPFLTNDHELMLEYPEEILEGTRLLMRAVGAEKAVIGIEANKSDAIAILREKAGPDASVSVVPLKVKYPQGGEKQLVDAVLGRKIPSGGLPASVGAVVQNVATAYAVWNAVVNGIPLVDRIVTVTGFGLSHPGNFRVPLGTPIADIVAFAGGMPDDTGKVVAGGPMMGKAVSNLSAASTKGLSGLLFVPQKYAAREEAEPCVRCASCVSACPMGLEPYLLARLSELKSCERLEAEQVMDCIECGSCSYVCVSHRPILDYVRIGKARVGAIIKERNTGKK